MQPLPAISPGTGAVPGAGERVPLPAGPESARRTASGTGAGRYGLAAAALLAAGLASAIVFRGDLRPAQQASLQDVAAVQQAAADEPRQNAPVEPPQSPLPVNRPAGDARPSPNGFSSPLPFFNSDESGGVPKISALQPYENRAKAGQPVPAGTVLPSANKLVTRLQPAAPARAFAKGNASLPASGPCPTCGNAVPGTRTNSGLQGGKLYLQSEVTSVYSGVCDGKYVYEYENVTANKTIGMKVNTSGGESWSFTLKPGQKIAIKSSTEFSGGNYESIRVSEVIN